VGIKRVQALAQWWQPYGYLLLPAVLGVAAAVYRLIVHGGRSPDWPLGAATIIAAIIIAAALEGGLFAARTRWPGSTARVLTNVLWYWPLFALIIASDRAADHKAFAGWEDVFVAGGIVTLVITIGNLAALRAENEVDRL
jgi:hypothetical protein